jgi:hypothetical protein
MATQKWKEENADKMRNYRNDYYARNKESEKKRILERKKQIVEFLRNYKERPDIKCKECGQDHPATLHFHHIDPSKKECIISKMASSGFSIERIMIEIEKCEVLCANCHAIFHYNERIHTS